MKLAIAVLAMGMCACNVPHGHSDGTIPLEARGPVLDHIENLNNGESACTFFWQSSTDGHVWLSAHSFSEYLVHRGGCNYSDGDNRATITKLSDGWKMRWRGTPNTSSLSDSYYEKLGYYRVTELEW